MEVERGQDQGCVCLFDCELRLIPGLLEKPTGNNHHLQQQQTQMCLHLVHISPIILREPLGDTQEGLWKANHASVNRKSLAEGRKTARLVRAQRD